MFWGTSLQFWQRFAVPVCIWCFEGRCYPNYILSNNTSPKKCEFSLITAEQVSKNGQLHICRHLKESQRMLVILSHFLQHMQLHQLQVPHPLSIYGNPDVTHCNVKLQRLETFFSTYFSCNHCVQVYRHCERLLRPTHVSITGLIRSNSQLSSSTWQKSALFPVMWPTTCRFQTPLRFCTTFCHFSTVLHQLQTTWAPSPSLTAAQLFYECFTNVWALKYNKAAIQKYLYSLYYNI